MNQPGRVDSLSLCSRRGAEIPASLAFEITRGKTQAPIRPLNREHFLLGAGGKCDLRLGGAGMAAIHSVVVQRDGEVLMEALADQPPLVVNGRVVQSVALQPGDTIEIGAFCLVLRAYTAPEVALAGGVESVPSAASHAEVGESPEDSGMQNLQALSAAELCERIEQEEELLSDFESRRRQGAESLLARVRALSARSSVQPVAEPPVKPQELVRELQTAVRELNRLVSALDQRLQQMPERTDARESASLLEFQQKLISRLDDVLLRISRLNDQKISRPRRDAA